MKERDQLKTALDKIDDLSQELDDAVTLIELGELESDDDTIHEGEQSLEKLVKKSARLRLESLLSGEADANDCFLEVHAGAGGTEAQDWALMIQRMYLRWAEQRGFGVAVTEVSEGEVAGIKSATVMIRGEYVRYAIDSDNIEVDADVLSASLGYRF